MGFKDSFGIYWTSVGDLPLGKYLVSKNCEISVFGSIRGGFKIRRTLDCLKFSLSQRIITVLLSYAVV